MHRFSDGPRNPRPSDKSPVRRRGVWVADWRERWNTKRYNMLESASAPIRTSCRGSTARSMNGNGGLVARYLPFALPVVIGSIRWRLCENTSVQVLMQSPSEQRRPNPSSCSDCSYQCGSAEDSDCPFHVVGEDVEAHLGCDVGQLSCSEVGPPHPILNRAEDGLDDAAPDPHRIGHLVQTPLHALDHSLVFPTGDAALLAGGAHGLRCAGAAVAGPVSAERQPVLDSGVTPDQRFACRAAVGVGFGLIDEVLLSEAPVGLRA